MASDPEVGKVYVLPVWVDRAGGRPWQSDPWSAGNFPSEMTVLGEGFPPGTFALAGNSHNRAPTQTLIVQYRDAISYTRQVERAFRDIAGGYQPVGAAHVLLHRDYAWQDNMLKILAACQDGRLYRVYTWLYLEQREYRYGQNGRWVPV